MTTLSVGLGASWANGASLVYHYILTTNLDVSVVLGGPDYNSAYGILNFDIPEFDPSLGTLNSVTALKAGAFEGYLYLDPGQDGKLNVESDIGSNSTYTWASEDGNSGSTAVFIFTPGGGMSDGHVHTTAYGIYGYTDTPTAVTYTDSPTLGSYEGNGTITYTLYNSSSLISDGYADWHGYGSVGMTLEYGFTSNGSGPSSTDDTEILTLGSGDTIATLSFAHHGALRQTGGNFTVSGNLTLTQGYDSNGTLVGNYDLSGGNGTAGNIAGSGSINLSGGVLTATNINHSGTITQSGGSLSATNFSQTGATYLDPAGNQTLGGVYAISNGTATFSNMTNNGIINHSGGNLTASNYTSTDGTYLDGSNTTQHYGVYNLSGGNLSIDNMSFGGTFNISGGHLSVANDIFVNSGTFTQSGGNINVYDGTVLTGNSTFSKTNGNASLSVLYLWPGTSFSQSGGYTDAGGNTEIDAGSTLTISGGTFLGGEGAITVGGTLVQTGGTISFDGLEFDNSTGGTMAAIMVSNSTLTANEIDTYANGTITLTSGSIAVSGAVYGADYLIINQSGGNLTASFIAVSTFTKTGGVVNASGFFGGDFAQSGGNASLGNVSGNGTITIGNGTTLTASKITMRSGTLNVNGNVTLSSTSATRHTSAVVLDIGNLTIGTSGLLNLANHDLIIHGGETLSQVTALIASAYDSGAWDGTHGITSSLNASAGTAIGYATAGELGVTTFDGVSVSSTDILIKYTYPGDANLDGKVTTADYTLYLAGVSSSATDWYGGDFNYDGTVNSSDLAIYTANSGAGVSSPLLIMADAGGSSVPEPGSVAILSLAVVRLRRPRKQR